MILSKSNITPRIRQQPPQKPKLINTKNALLKLSSLKKHDFGLKKNIFKA